jgi:16S rRNA (cytidine1402-2'-O)-methyltransferase
VTKLHEEFLRGKLSYVIGELEARPPKGEITFLIGPPDQSASGALNTSQSLAARVDELVHQAKLDRKEALKLAAKERGIPKRDAYRQLLNESSSTEE